MEKTSPSKPSRRLLLLPAFAVAGLVLVTWSGWKRVQPERLRRAGALDFPQYGAVSNGMFFRTSDRNSPVKSDAPTIFAGAVAGPERILVAEDARFSFATQPVLSILGGSVRYGISSTIKPQALGGIPRPFSPGGYPKPAIMAGVSADRSPGPRRYLGAFATAPNPLSSEERRKSLPPTPPSPDTVIFRQIPEQGGKPRDLVTVRGTGSVLIGNSVFWIRPAPDNRVEVRLGSDAWTEMAGRSELMLTDTESRKARQICSGISSVTTLTPGHSGVFWTKPCPFPDRGRECFYASAADGKVHRLGRLEPNQAIGWSLETNHTLYWFVSGTRADPVILMAADLNSTNPHAVFSHDDPPFDPVSGEDLAVYKDALFCLVQDSRPNIPLRAREIFVARVRPGTPHPVDIQAKLPASAYGFHFDQGYLYYYVSEVERGLIESITADETGARRAEVLLRIRLPR